MHLRLWRKISGRRHGVGWLVGFDGDGADALGFGANHAAAELGRLRLAGRIRGGDNHRLLFARYEALARGAIVATVGNHPVGLRILAGRGRHDLARRLLGFDHGRRRCRRRPEDCAVAEGAGGSHHREGEHAGNRQHADAAATRRYVVVIIVIGAELRAELRLPALKLFLLVTCVRWKSGGRITRRAVARHVVIRRGITGRLRAGQRKTLARIVRVINVIADGDRRAAEGLTREILGTV